MEDKDEDQEEEEEDEVEVRALKTYAHRDVRAAGITCIRQLAFCMCCAH